MIQQELTKYGFRVRTRSGVVVDHLLIHGSTEEDATRKLCQMYPACVILESWQETTHSRPVSSSFEEVVDLITPPRH